MDKCFSVLVKEGHLADKLGLVPLLVILIQIDREILADRCARDASHFFFINSGCQVIEGL